MYQFQTWAYTPDRSKQTACDSTTFNYGKASFLENIDMIIGNKRYIGQRVRDYHLGPWRWHSLRTLDACWPDGIEEPRATENHANNETTSSRRDPLELKVEGKQKKKQKKMKKAEKKSKKIKDAAAAKLTEQVDAGLHPCCQTNRHGNRCMCVFSFEKYRDNHNQNGKSSEHCKFCSQSLMDRVTKLAANDAKMIALGSNVLVHNKSEGAFKPIDKNQVADSVPGYNLVFVDQSLGQCRKRKTNKHDAKMMPTCHEYLQMQYNGGTGENAIRLPVSVVRNNMAKQRLKSTNNLVFSRREGNPHGQLPSIARIKSWFSRKTAEQGDNGLDPRFVFWKQHSVLKLRELVAGANVASKKAPYLAEVLKKKDAASGKTFGFVDGIYHDHVYPY